MNRRKFSKLVSGATGVAALAPFPTLWPARKSSVGRLILQGGLLFDGLGGPPIVADVVIEDDRILAIGTNLSTTGADVVDARGLAVSPGFIDIHSHTDLSLLDNPNAESKIRQGVTTEVVGQDGGSIGPWSDERFESIRNRFRDSYDVLIDFRHLAEFFGRLEVDRPSINLASMIGTGTVRAFVIGYEEREASPDELAQMSSIVDAALRAGACGVSSGLEYIPNAFANTDELIQLAAPLAGTGLPYASHMRNEDDTVFGAIEEALHVGRMAGVPVHLSHLKSIGKRNWWKQEPILNMLEEASEDGLTVSYDRYPYVAYSTTLASLFPVWSREGGTRAFIGRLEGEDTADRIRIETLAKIQRMGDWNSVQITAASEDSLQWVNGRRLGELADERQVDPFELAKQIVVADNNRTDIVGFGMSEENTEIFLSHPLGMICSDAGARAPYGRLSVGSPHPRAYGSYPRVLGHYCRERTIMPLETAIMKMTSMPARLIKLEGRGQIAVGAFADIVVFDPATVADQATFEDPHQYPVGIEYVLVNGTTVMNRGQHTESRVGRVLRPTANE
jgi:N-acyl-D-amino-acid deacylase